MSEYFIIMSFELNEKSLINDWIALSKEIDEVKRTKSDLQNTTQKTKEQAT